MKINVQIFTLLLILFSTQPITSFFEEDQFENNLIKKMDDIEKKIQESFNNFHDQFFKDFDERTTAINNQINNINSNQNNSRFYRHSSNSISFANKEKGFEIQEKIEQNIKLYSITITDKKQNLTNQSSTETTDIESELKKLQIYIKKSFNMQSAENIIASCLTAIATHQNDQSVTLEKSTEHNQTKYTIKVISKKSSDNPDNNTEPHTEEEEHNKKKKYMPSKRITK